MKRSAQTGIRTGPESPPRWRRAISGFAFVAASLTAAHSQAQPTSFPPKEATEIITLGTAGGPGLRPQRSQPATLLIVSGTPYLFDCGTGAVRQLARAGIEPSSIRAIFITHHHADHDLDLAALMGNIRLGPVPAPADQPTKWPIYGPEGTTEMVRAARQFLHVAFESFAAEGLGGGTDFGKSAETSLFEPHEISAGEIYRDRLIKVTAIENTHYDLMPEQQKTRLKSYTFRIETCDAVIVVTGDTGKSEAVTRLAKGADVMVTEAMDIPAMLGVLDRQVADGAMSADGLKIRKDHMRIGHIDLPDVGNMAAAASLRSLILTHLGPETDNQPDARIAAKVQAVYSGQVFVASDLDHYCILPAGARQDGALRRC